MKKSTICKFANMSLLFMVLILCTACSDSDIDEVLTPPVTPDEHSAGGDNQTSGEQYGQFIIKNLSSGEILEGDDSKIIPEDMLAISFVPNEKFKNLSFEFNNKYNGKEVEDTFAIHSTSIKVEANGKEIESVHRIVLSAFANNDGKEIKVSRTVNLKFHDKSSRVVCQTRAMADLLMFVEPVISFSDDKGNSINCRPFEGMTIRRDSVKKEDIELELANVSDRSFRYTQWGSEAEATLSFVKKQPVELTRESYDLDCAVALYGHAYQKDFSPSTMSINISIEINIGGTNKMEDEYGKIKKEYVEEYINKLVETTQTKRIIIDENGKVTQLFD